MTAFLDYGERIGLSYFPCKPGQKYPAVAWTRESSMERARAEEWRTQGFNLGINAAQSGLIILDIDSSKVGPPKAWAAYHSLCLSWGLKEVLPVHCHTARGGWHAYIQRPADVSADDLRGTHVLVRDDAGNELIGARVRAYAVAPGSVLHTDKGPLHYLAAENLAEPQPCPAALLDALRLPAVESKATTSGDTDVADVEGLVDFLNEHGEFDDYDSWVRALGAVKLALGDKGLPVAQRFTWPVVSEVELHEKWKSLSSEARPRDYTIASLIQRARQLGWKGAIRKSTEAMFRDAVASLPKVESPPTAPSNSLVLPRGHVEFVPSDSDESLTVSFVAKHGHELRYVAAQGRWYEWDGKRWRPDSTLRAFDLARGVIREVANVIDPRTASKLASAPRVAAVERMAKADRAIAATVDQFDADPWVLNTPGGIVNLRTGEMRETEPQDYVTKSTAVAPDGDCPTWLAFLDRIMGGDPELVGFLQRFLGYCLTGLTTEQVLAFGHGNGANGKGVLLNTVAGILGDYHRTASVEVFTASNRDRHPTDVAGLCGARLVTCTETERNRTWAEARVKELTGGDKITARFMRQDFFDFTPSFKLFITGNHRPRITSVDEAIRRRFNLIPFAVTIPPHERDPRLTEKLKAEWPGILKWMLTGCMEWQTRGLQPPKAVLDATADYLTAEDAMAAWQEDRCERDPSAFTVREDLWRSWQTWCLSTGEPAGSSRAFKDELVKRGFENVKSGGRHGHRGLRLKPLGFPVMPPT